MKISLDDDIWTRLYGPYGVQNVPELISQLNDSWDNDIASDLFWENLHHQNDLYPVTYAAMPWVYEFAQKQTSEAKFEICSFLSYAILCALAPVDDSAVGSIPRNCFCGLSYDVPKHRHSWLKPDQWLREDDTETLKQIEEWFQTHHHEIAEFCFDLAENVSAEKVGFLISGYCAVRGAFDLAYAVDGIQGDGVILCPKCLRPHYIIWKDGDPEFELHPDGFGWTSDSDPSANEAVERFVAIEVAKRFEQSQPQIARFFHTYANWTCCE